MNRVASQLTFCSPQVILHRAVLERADKKVITRIFNLDDSLVESAQTLFFDGIISAEIVSLKNNIHAEKLEDLIKDYMYIDLSNETDMFEIQPSNKPLLIDFGTNSLEKINFIIAKFATKLQDIPIFDLIAACVYFPLVLLGNQPDLEVNRQTNLLLWENLDLPNKRLTPTVRIREI